MIGIAKPSPIEPLCELNPVPNVAIAELIPITAPVESTSGPPEFPGLIAASVCRAFMKELLLPLSPAVTARSFALMIPRVTVPDSPSGDPIAITESPTATLSLSPSWSAVKPVVAILRTARS